MIEQWAPAKRKRKLKHAEPPTAAQQAKALRRAIALCRRATSDEARRLADGLAQRWTGCNCAQLMNKNHRTDELQ